MLAPTLRRLAFAPGARQLYSTVGGLRSYDDIPIEQDPENIRNAIGEKEMNFKTIGDYLYLNKGPIARTSTDVFGQEQVWVFSDQGLRDILHQEGMTPDGSGIFQLPMMKYNEEKLNGKLWPWIRGEKWRKQRMMAQKHLFGHLDTISYGDVINSVSKRVGDNFPRWMEKPLDQSLFSQTSSFEFIYGIIFGRNPGLIDGTGLADEQKFIHEALSLFRILFFEFLANPEEMDRFVKHGTSSKYQELSDVLDYLMSYGENAIKKMLKEVEEGTTDPFVLNSYIARQHRENPDLDIQTLSANGAVLLAAGVDTTSCSISMMLAKLAEDPELQEEMVEEMKTLAGGDVSRGFQPELREKYHVIKSVFRELARLTPVVGFFSRRIHQTISVDGYEIPANTILLCMSGQQHALESDLWDDYDKFNPRRWYPLTEGRRNVDKELSKKWTDSQIANFGRGSHKCPGARIAESEIMSFFCEILPRYKLKATWDPANPPYQYSWAKGFGSYQNIPKIDVENRHNRFF